jgi:Family of unknown function (DUF6444)
MSMFTIRIARIAAKFQRLEAENMSLKKNSANSSKPPSSHIVKPTPLKERRKKLQCKIGEQRRFILKHDKKMKSRFGSISKCKV